MTGPLATYSFLPWLRQGLAGQITAQDLDVNVHARASDDPLTSPQTYVR